MIENSTIGQAVQFPSIPNSHDMQSDPYFTKVSARPAPFLTTLTLEIASLQNQQIIVKMTGESGDIVRLFGWYLLKGTNVTTLKDLGKLSVGLYTLSILNINGELLHELDIQKN